MKSSNLSQASQAFLKLFEIQKACRANASQLPNSGGEIRSSWTGVGVGFNGIKCACPMGEVMEVLTTPRLTKVPGVGSWVKGVANVRGRLLPILDLMEYFYQKTSSKHFSRRRVVVIESGDLYSGLVVDDVYGMQHFQLEQYVSEIPPIDSVIKPYIKGAYRRDDEWWFVFSPLMLTHDTKFMKLAS